MPEARPLSYTDDQLHERACIVCGKDDGELLPAGHVQTEGVDGNILTWAAAACPSCKGDRS
jgi:hypothetical protein